MLIQDTASGNIEKKTYQKHPVNCFTKNER